MLLRGRGFAPVNTLRSLYPCSIRALSALSVLPLSLAPSDRAKLAFRACIIQESFGADAAVDRGRATARRRPFVIHRPPLPLKAGAFIGASAVNNASPPARRAGHR